EADPHEVARAIVLRQLTAAPRSRRQLEDKLAQRGCDPEVAREVLDRMEAVGLVDDEAYAHMLVRSQQQGRGLARRGLAHELRRKGIDEEVAQQALADEVTPDGERARAEQLVAKKLRTMSGLDRQVKTRRLAGMLARKGYSGEVAYSVIREALDQDPEHQRD
ncbi:regulatory protein RecX, partial [Kytococcus schroeteri]